MTRFRMLLFALALTVVGCAPATTADTGGTRRDATRITTQEIERAYYNTVFELVQALRPAWVQTRGAMSIQDPTAGQAVVYLDGTRMGGVDQLRQLRTADVESIQYLNGTEASARFGLGHMGGAILVASKRGP